MSRRRVTFLTGTRADFGKLKPLMGALANDDDFEVSAFVTGMHMLGRYGLTVTEVVRSGLVEVFPFYNQDGNGRTSMPGALATTVQGLSHFVQERNPDLLVVHGDRVEALAGAIVGALGNVLVAHIEGGELSGTVDELIRHAATKLSHVHFVANGEAGRRLEWMGERADHIYVIGSPDIDVMLSPDLPSLDEVLAHYDIPFDDYGILLYHPVTTEISSVYARANGLVDAVLASGERFVVVSPNNDHGADAVETALARLSDPTRFRRLPSLRFESFLALLREAKAIVGNSSAGIREAPVYGVQTINVGSRQRNRFRHASIIDCDEQNPDLEGTIAAIGKRYPPSQHFGSGNSAEAFSKVLRSDSFWKIPRQKQFVDIGEIAGQAQRPR